MASDAEATLEDGRHAVYLHGIEVDARTLTVDVIRFLTGQAAIWVTVTDGRITAIEEQYVP
ncbi:MAG TPA: hypothetical protein VM324_11165 [Egibacteraceae bacterium]|nr:hypothetical protein [Egibacteraceae bacterium]